MLRRLLKCLLLLLWFQSASIAQPAFDPSTLPDKAPRFDEFVASQIDAELDALEDGGSFSSAARRLNGLFDTVIAHGSMDETELFVETAYAARLVNQLVATDAADRAELLKFFRANEDFARTLVFLIHPDEDVQEIYTLVNTLRKARGSSLNRYANLAAAICVVHDKKLVTNANENSAEAISPIKIYDFYRKNASRMLYGVTSMPAELLIFVVDTTATLDEMYWALNNYKGNRRIGQVYHSIKYDTQAFRTGDPKAVTQAGWNLLNIQRYGGVCVDQAYFASTVGKAIGCPTVMDSARGNVAHCWVGFMETGGGNSWWNFDEGRYEDYENIQGTVRNPQTRGYMPDSYVAIAGSLAKTKRSRRHYAAAMNDAAIRVRALEEEDVPAFPTAARSPDGGHTARDRSVQTQLDLLEAGIGKCPGYVPAWTTMMDMADSRMLDADQKSRWLDAAYNFCGKRYPEFTLDAITPMIESVPDPTKQSELWDWAFGRYTHRPDLASRIRLNQGKLWERNNERSKAWKCYTDVVNRYLDDGPFAVDAIEAAEQMLVNARKTEFVLELYAEAFNRLEHPERMADEFYFQTAYYRIGTTYASWLERFDDENQAKRVRKQIGRN